MQKTEAVTPPFLSVLVEKIKRKFSGEASVRTADASVPSQVSVKNKRSIIFSLMKSLIIKVSLDNERTFKSARLRVLGEFVVDGMGGWEL